MALRGCDLVSLSILPLAAACAILGGCSASAPSADHTAATPRVSASGAASPAAGTDTIPKPLATQTLPPKPLVIQTPVTHTLVDDSLTVIVLPTPPNPTTPVPTTTHISTRTITPTKTPAPTVRISGPSPRGHVARSERTPSPIPTTRATQATHPQPRLSDGITSTQTPRASNTSAPDVTSVSTERASTLPGPAAPTGECTPERSPAGPGSAPSPLNAPPEPQACPADGGTDGTATPVVTSPPSPTGSAPLTDSPTISTDPTRR